MQRLRAGKSLVLSEGARGAALRLLGQGPRAGTRPPGAARPRLTAPPTLGPTKGNKDSQGATKASREAALVLWSHISPAQEVPPPRPSHHVCHQPGQGPCAETPAAPGRPPCSFQAVPARRGLFPPRTRVLGALCVCVGGVGPGPRQTDEDPDTVTV